MHEADKFLAAHNKTLSAVNGASMPVENGGLCSDGSNQERASFLLPKRYPVILSGLMLLSGLFAILAAVIRQLSIGLPDILAAVIVAPPVEEILKVAIPIMVLEHRTQWVGKGWDLLLFAMGSALVFGVVENLLYTLVYLSSPSADVLLWRWVGCTTLHIVASGLSGVGLMRAYNRGQRDNQPPRFIWEWPWLAGAIAVHMAYNMFAVLFVEPF